MDLSRLFGAQIGLWGARLLTLPVIRNRGDEAGIGVADTLDHNVRRFTREIVALQRWRRRVVRLWIATMLAAIGVWAMVAAIALPWAVELSAAAVLGILVGVSVWQMRRGRCPSCGRKIQFQPRIELPLACPHCSTSFVVSP